MVMGLIPSPGTCNFSSVALPPRAADIDPLLSLRLKRTRIPGHRRTATHNGPPIGLEKEQQPPIPILVLFILPLTE
ncbi:hypothetical protein RP20_CCG000555 [Aedes albopictus]|nr:hypothetical protein RP20_CCG000555 [Aedes albopictus]